MRIILVAGLVLAVTGCATTTSSKTLQSRTAGILGVPIEGVSIGDMRTDSSSTYYTATVNGHRYACVAEGGALKVFQLGMTNPPTCRRAN